MKLEVDLVKNFLTETTGEEVLTVETLQGGDWSQAFGAQTRSSSLVVRFGKYEDDFLKDETASLFHAPDLPTPRVFAIGEAFGGYFCISERFFGTMLEDVDSESLRRLVPSIFKTFDALRTCDVSPWVARFGAPSTSWQEQLLSVDEENERVYGWHDRMKASKLGTSSYSKALDFLRDRVGDCPGEWYLQHNDLLHQNVLTANDRITGVFDWGCAGLGDFLYDVAIFAFYEPWFSSMTDFNWQNLFKSHFDELHLQVPDFDSRMRCYRVHVGLAGMAYNSFIGDWQDFERHQIRTMQLIESDSSD